VRILKNLTFTILFFVVCVCARADGTGTVTGAVTDPTGAMIPGALISFHSVGLDFKMSTKTDANGQYTLQNVPLGRFELTVEVRGFTALRYTGELKSPVPFVHDVHFQAVGRKMQRVTVQEVTNDEAALETRSSMTRQNLDPEQFEKWPSAPQNQVMSAVVESVPGLVPEENGRIHVRGSEMQPQYVLDGVPFSDTPGGTAGTGLDTENLRAAEMITGNIPAEFGGKSSSVVNLTTKSGLGIPWRAALALSAGSLEVSAIDAEVGGQIKKVGIFLTADASETHRFLDPPEIQNFRNRGGLAHLFGRFDLQASRNNVVRLTLSANGSAFQVPNLVEQELEGQRERQELRDDYQALHWTHIFNATTVADLTFFRRSSTAKLLDPDLTGTPFFIEQHRNQRTEGLQVGVTKNWARNSLKFGVEASRLPLTEHFTLAVTDPEDVAPDSPVLAYTLDRPFLFAAKRTGTRASWYAQNHLRITQHLSADVGLRFDYYNLLIRDSAFSPRVGLAYYLERTGTVFRASYNRLFNTPSLENLLLSSSPDAARLSSDDVPALPVPAERQDMYEFGVQQKLGSRLRLDVRRYVKTIQNTADEEQLFTTAVVFPIALSHADIRGTEVRLDLAGIRGFSAYASYANARATDTGPLVGGLFLGSGEEDLFEAASKFPADQDERNEVQFGVTYNHRSGAWFHFTGRHDSGLPTEFDPDDFSEFDPRIQAQVDPGRSRIKPRTVYGIAAGVTLWHDSPLSMALQLSVNNLTDQFYLYNFQSAFSGTHIGRPREVVGRIVFHWRGNK
jgi:outer membrane receptor protein involved in Fe transport